MKIVKESLNELPTWDDILSSAPQEILDLIEESKNIPQGAYWHPEGEVYKHIRIVFDRARQYGDINLLMSALFHDLGKVNTTAPNKYGSWSAIGHEKVSARLVDSYKNWIREMGGTPDLVKEIVDQHMRIKQMPEMRPVKQEAMKKLQTYDLLLHFTEFDDMSTLTNDELNRYK